MAHEGKGTNGYVYTTNGTTSSWQPSSNIVQSGVQNIGINYASGTGIFKVTSQDGTALSSSNPAYVTLQSKSSPGYLVTVSVESDQNFIDDNGSSEIIGNLFGLTTGVAYGEDIPFFLYAVLNDDEDAIQFMISRNPSATTSPAAANIGAPDDAVADAQGDFWSFDNITETEWDSNPCLCIGSFRMQMSASDDWTVQTLSNADGIGQFHSETIFDFPTGVMGAATGTYIKSNAGTEPIFTSNNMNYNITKTGRVTYRFNGQNASTAGVGAQTLEPVLPYANGATSQESTNHGVFTDATDGSRKMGNATILSSGAEVNTFVTHGNAANFSNATIASGDSLQFELTYNAYN